MRTAHLLAALACCGLLIGSVGAMDGSQRPDAIRTKDIELVTKQGEDRTPTHDTPTRRGGDGGGRFQRIESRSPETSDDETSGDEGTGTGAGGGGAAADAVAADRTGVRRRGGRPQQHINKNGAVETANPVAVQNQKSAYHMAREVCDEVKALIDQAKHAGGQVTLKQDSQDHICAALIGILQAQSEELKDCASIKVIKSGQSNTITQADLEKALPLLETKRDNLKLDYQGANGEKAMWPKNVWFGASVMAAVVGVLGVGPAIECTRYYAGSGKANENRWKELHETYEFLQGIHTPTPQQEAVLTETKASLEKVVAKRPLKFLGTHNINFHMQSLLIGSWIMVGLGLVGGIASPFTWKARCNRKAFNRIASNLSDASRASSQSAGSRMGGAFREAMSQI